MQKRQGGFLVSKIHQLAGRIFTKKLKDYDLYDLNSAQGRIIFVLWQNDEISIQELSKRTSLEKSTLSRMLERLENSGYIQRIASADDRRKTLVKLTPKNEELKDAYEEVSNDMLDLFYKGFTEDEIDEFESYLKKIHENLFQFEKNSKKGE
ncbi:MarR family winged helix-turn-helix transcriptional regulator [Inconstantimicrobium mannanitabidum]|uniref:Radical SAM mobile pair system MarR family transcriptional regulator n=1 Tax=Inconstantimicrobium mannanitabidum TaxID=1604901 RepID=A0ACB5RB72_9CLOT|nr:MarR family transcriptional regulator [Clostridium sp. TW13]GKX66453.1 radical SAM mobile pair system MarR family transcriptional regulator [Clostridium sp. TW13]